MTKLRALAIVIVLGGCVDLAPAPPSTDAGADPAVGNCCWLLAWGGDVASCVRDLTDEGQCRWLHCLGGLVTYEVCR